MVEFITIGKIPENSKSLIIYLLWRLCITKSTFFYLNSLKLTNIIKKRNE